MAKQNLLLPTELQLTKAQQQRYLDKFAIKFESLPNGIKLISANRSVPDVQVTDIRVRFRVGSSNDPKGIDGLSHFAEHFVFTGCKYAPTYRDRIMKAEMGGYKLGGSTGLWDTKFEVTTSSSLTDDNFGIIVGNKHLISTITEPLFLEDAFEKERGVILDESKRKFLSLGFLNAYQIFAKVFPLNHPMQKITVGTEKSLTKITTYLIKDHVWKYYTPQNTYLSILSDGNVTKHERVVSLVKKVWNDNFQNSQGISFKLPTIDKLSGYKELKREEKHYYKTKVSENRVLVSLAMVGVIKPYTRENMALNLALMTLDREIFHTLRSKGFGYATIFETDDLPLSGVGILTVGMQVEKNIYKKLEKSIEALFNTGIKRIIDEGLCEQIVERERLRQLDTPVSLSTRIGHTIEGLRDYGQVINSDEVRKIYLTVKPDDVKKMLLMFAEMPKGLFICGDF